MKKTKTGFTFAVGYVAVIWGVHIVNTVVFGGSLSAFGIEPRDTSSLVGILFAPLLHADLSHLISNTAPGAIFSFLVGCTGARTWWEVTGFTVLVAGAGIWFFGAAGSVHIGASSLVYGWLAYLVVRGVFNRSLGQLAVGITVGVAYSGLIWGILPGTPGISWQGHLFGALGGILAGMTITSDDPVRATSLDNRAATRP